MNLPMAGFEHTNNFSGEQTARLMGDRFIRVRFHKGILPFWYAVKLSANCFTYYICPKKFTEHTEIKID